MAFQLFAAVVCCATLFQSLNAKAGTVFPAEFGGQPLIYQKEGRINGCGVRVVGLTQFSTPKELVRVLDSSIVFYAEGMSLIKAGIGTTTGAGVNTQNLNLKPVRISSFWMRREGANPTAPQSGQILKSPDDPTFLYYSIPLPSFAELSEVIYGQVELQVGVRPEKSGVEWVMGGKLAMSEGDIRRFGECVDVLLKNLNEQKGTR